MQSRLSIGNNVYPLLSLAIPLIATGLAQAAAYYFIILFLAHLGTLLLAASALVNALYQVLFAITGATLISINILVSHKHGENDVENISVIARDGLLLATLLAIPGFLFLWNASPIFLLLGQPESVVVLSKSYLHAMAWGLFPTLLSMACLEAIVGIGKARVLLIFSLISTCLNLFLSYSLIFGKFGFPALSIEGAGWGMTIQSWIMFLGLITFILINKKLKPYFLHTFKFKQPVFLRELFYVGAPIGIMFTFEVGFFFVLTLAMGILGTLDQAANQVVMQYLYLTMIPVFSFAQATTVRMGHLLGAKTPLEARMTSDISLSIVIIYMGVIACLYWFVPQLLILADLNIHDPLNFEIIQKIQSFLTLCALFQIFEAARISLFSSLRALKDTRFTMFISIASVWLIGLPIGFLLAIYLNFGGTGFWWGMVIGSVISVIFFYQRFKSKIEQLTLILDS